MIIHIILLFLLCVAKGSSSLIIRDRRNDSNRISTLQGKPNTHAWITEGSSQATFGLSFRVVDQGHTPRAQDRSPVTHGVALQVPFYPFYWSYP